MFAWSVQAADSLVFDFESGDLAQENWSIVWGENSRPVGNRAIEFHSNTEPYDKHGDFYLTTLETAENDAPTDDPQCIIESPVFTLEGKTVSLLVGGGMRQLTLIALCVVDENNNTVIVREARGSNSQKLEEITWDTSDLVGKKVVIRVIDQEIGGWAHIRCDYIRTEGTIDFAATQARRDAMIAQQEAERQEKERQENELRESAMARLTMPVLYIQRNQYTPDHHNTATLFQKGEINEGSFRGGSAMKVWFPQKNETKTLLELPEGIVRDPTISFDAEKVLFSFRKSREDAYHIGEMTLDFDRAPIVLNPDTPTDNIEGFRQLTFIDGISDIDPIYLPTGDILFTSTREPKYCMCNRHIMCNLHIMDADGNNIQQIGKSTLFEGHPSLLPDGRILYDRWEYVDRDFGDAQGIWVTNPDGTKHEIFWGNNTASPGAVIDARILPDSDSAMVCVFGSCHDRPWGAVAIVDRRLGIDGREAVLETWPPEAIDWVSTTPGENPLREVYKYDIYRQTKPLLEDPYPLDDHSFLASGHTGVGEEMGIWYLETGGKMLLLYKDAPGCFDPTPIVETEPPMVIGNRVNLEDPYGYFHITNVYEGFGMEKVKPGSVKYLRVVESPEKRFWTMTAWSGSGTQAPGMSWDDFNNKRILGTVPVEEDGSVSVRIPAERYVYFQILDEKGMMIQSMRSGIMVRPGETNACVGCHESRIDAPASLNLAPKALSGPPQDLKPWYGNERLFSYVTEVQPVFDKYCVACHDYDGPGAEKVILAGDLNMAFNTSYTQLRMKELVKPLGAGPHNTLSPYSWGSSQSKLVTILMNGHPKPEIDQKRKELGLWFDRTTDQEAFDRIVTWIDINAPYYPTYASAYRDNPIGRSPLSEEQTKRLEALVNSAPVLTGPPSNRPEGYENIQRLYPQVFDVSFTRPEKSPCLKKWDTEESRQSAEYKEALAIITAGKEALEKQSRGEDENFVPVAPVEITQQEKYDMLRLREHKMREAILHGEKRNDLNVLN